MRGERKNERREEKYKAYKRSFNYRNRSLSHYQITRLSTTSLHSSPYRQAYSDNSDIYQQKLDLLLQPIEQRN